ncbi:transcriptional regulator, LacI family [Flavobacterium glycines]|uniref:LacI family transcriptional regulator n=1 Tax=Flavobacterium glycines TaxID=551990 RepID=A0A1B9DR81_9FLAO|nr:LacI family DNA-binding transcriptional regulator [Flavobacterium glycines]OCB72209.1 LacI family transcriptional regulator [Flavobacterium glycines]GEL09664.1 LacI family transcriptional regulator [Flavobacterium glycines]SDI98295.1 transcriptional regulator, LacI family [Flavobacterium glycines]
MKTKITISDIAKELGIAPATVSRALSNHPEISVATKKKVKAVAERLDYRPNKLASSLRSGKTKLIGVLIPTAEHLFFGSVIHGISNLASQQGYDVLIYQSNESEEFEKKGIETFINARVDGILVSISKNTTDYSHFELVKEKNIPIAFFDRTNDNLGISSVSIDDYLGAYIATESLIKSGYKRIAHISGPQHSKAFAERVRGYQAALNQYNIPFENNLIYNGDISIEAGRKGVQHFLNLENKPDAIFAVEDFTALGTLKELKEMGIKVPEEFGIIGFCNDLFGEHITPSLSTVDQKTVQMGEEAFNLIYELISKKGEKTNSQKRVLTPTLILRESSKKN